MSSSNSVYTQLLADVTVYLYQYGNLMIFALGNIGNALSALVFCKKSWSKNVCVLYFKVCLFLSSVYLNSAVLGTSLISGFQINVQNRSAVLCKLFNYIARVVPMMLPSVLVLASIDRLLISSRHVDTRLYSSKRLAYLSISVSAVFSIAYSIHVLVKVDVRELYPSQFFCSSDLSKSYTDFVLYSSTALNCIFCLSMTVLSILSLKNVRRMRAIPREHRVRIRLMTKKDAQLLRCLFSLDVIYSMISIFPSVYSVFSTAKVTVGYTSTPVEGAINNFVKNLSTISYFSFYGVHFFVFVAVSRTFRLELKRIVCKLFGQDVRLISRTEDHAEVNVVVVSGVGPSVVVVQ